MRMHAAVKTAGHSASDAQGAEARPPEKWSEAKRLAFKELAPAALALVATDGPVSVTLFGAAGGVTQRIGHNRGVWPAKIARTMAWKDTVSASYDKNPFFFLGTQLRLWLPSEQERDLLAASAVDFLAERSDRDGGLDRMLNSFQDLGPELDFALFELELRDIAERLGVRQVWDDAGLSGFLDRVVARAEALRAEGRGKRRIEDALDAAVMTELQRGR